MFEAPTPQKLKLVEKEASGALVKDAKGVRLEFNNWDTLLRKRA
jgi:hypothetical protein